jgi:hypothetical protein
MRVTYFDSSEPFAEPGVADVDRVYRFAWRSFDATHWHALDQIYHELPGWCGYVAQRLPGWRGLLGRAYDMPFWFGSEVGTPPYLTASVEPPGLQVTGKLPRADFERWHELFLAAVADLLAGEPA